MSEPIICDTSVWLYLGRLAQTALLQQRYTSVYTTETVCWELDNGRIIRRDTVDPRQLGWIHIVEPDERDVALLPANRLGPGERSVLAYARAHTLNIVGLDDRQARQLALRLGLRVTGSIGTLIKAKEAGLITAVRPLLTQLQQECISASRYLIMPYAERKKGKRPSPKAK